jgi:hypothetical protein
MATADIFGRSSVILVGMWGWEGEDTLVVDNYLNKIRRNLEANPQVAFVGWDREARRAYQIKGRAEILKEGPIYEKGHKRAASRERPLPGKAVVVAVEEVYEAMVGESAGDRIV